MLTIFCVCACAVTFLGCKSTLRKSPNPNPKLISFAATDSKKNNPARKAEKGVSPNSVEQVAFQQVENESEVFSIPLTIDEQSEPDSSVLQQPALSGNVTLAELEEFLLSSHPQILKAQSQLLALTGKELQAGLPPNPTIGITAEDINANDGAGRYGVFFGRQIVRGGKLELAQSVVQAEIEVARERLAITRRQLLIELRNRYYNALLAVETVRQAQELTDVLKRSVDTSEKLFDAQEIAKAPVVRSQVELKNAEMMVRQAENQKTSAMRQLAAVLGETEIKFECLAGDVQDIPFIDDFEMAFDQMLDNHPELSAALAQIETSKRELIKQSAAPIPNLTWQTSLLYDFTTDEMVGGFQIGMPLPRYNRNEGAIFQAQQNIQTSIHAADQKLLELRDRLTDAWTNYVDARIQLETLDNEILPKAEEALALANAGYRQGETPYLELLLAQQLYAKTKLGYLSKLRQRWQYHVVIEGLISDFDERCE